MSFGHNNRTGLPDRPKANIDRIMVDTKDPTGWIDPTAITVTYNVASDTVTLSGTLDYYWRGVKKSLTSPWTSTAHPAGTGVSYFLYTTDGTNFTWSTTPWAFSDLMVAYIQHGSVDLFGIREVHGLMPWTCHEEFHENVGTYRKSGGTLSAYVIGSTVAANRRPQVAATVAKDEDIETTVPSLTSGVYNNLTLTSTGVSTFATAATDIVPLSGAQPYWNSYSAPNWGQTLMSNNSYMCVWLIAVPATADATSQGYRYLWLQGQSNGTLASQQALSPKDLNLGSLSALATEYVFITKIIIRYTAANWTFESVEDLSGSKVSFSGTPAGYLTSVSTDATMTGDGTVGNPLSVVPVTAAVTATQVSCAVGAVPVYSKKFTIADAGISPTSKIITSLVRESDEVEFSGVQCVAHAPGSGTFDLTIFSTDGPTSGTFKVNYVVG